MPEDEGLAQTRGWYELMAWYEAAIQSAIDAAYLKEANDGIMGYDSLECHDRFGC